MTNELVLRLRGLGDPQNWASDHAVALCEEAANAIERLTERIKDLQQFHDWAEPQITDLKRGSTAEPPAPRDIPKEVATEFAQFGFARVVGCDHEKMREVMKQNGFTNARMQCGNCREDVRYVAAEPPVTRHTIPCIVDGCPNDAREGLVGCGQHSPPRTTAVKP